MKIAVFRTLTAFSRGMENAVAEYKPDQIIHLGDGMRDAEALRENSHCSPCAAFPATATDTMTARRLTSS